MDAGSTPTGADAGESPPTRNNTCTPLSQQTGTAVNTNHGRMDGTLVYILPIDGSSSCNGDGSHVHLQVAMGGDVYDVAVDIGKSGDEVGWYRLAQVQKKLGNTEEQRRALAEYRRLHEKSNPDSKTQELFSPSEVTKQQVEPTAEP